MTEGKIEDITVREGESFMKLTRRSFAKMAVAGAAGLYFPGKAKGAELKTEMKMKTNKVKKGLVVWYSQTGNTKRIGKLIAATWA